MEPVGCKIAHVTNCKGDYAERLRGIKISRDVSGIMKWFGSTMPLLNWMITNDKFDLKEFAKACAYSLMVWFCCTSLIKVMVKASKHRARSIYLECLHPEIE